MGNQSKPQRLGANRSIDTGASWPSVVALAAALLLVGAAAWLLLADLTEASCRSALGEAGRFARSGELRRALETIDRTDAVFDCSSLTEGDAPPEYSAARAYLRELRAVEGTDAAKTFIVSARGPILRDLARGGLKGR